MKKTKNNPKCSTSYFVTNDFSLKCEKLSEGPVVLFLISKWTYLESKYCYRDKWVHFEFFSLIKTFIYRCCEVLNMKLNMAWYPQWICRRSLSRCLFCCRFVFRNINWHISSGSSFWLLAFLYITDMKNVLLKNHFFQKLASYFSLFNLFAYYIQVVF